MRRLLILLCLCYNLTVSGTTYYISTSGSDSNNGTSSSPWATLAYAVSHATSGDIIHINAGSYTISSQISVPAGISIEGDGNTTVLNSTVSSDYTLLLSSGTQGTNGNQHISNLKMSGGSGLNSYSAYSPLEVIMRSNVEIANCTFQYFSYRGPRFAGSTSTQPSTYSIGNSFHNNTVLDCCNFVGIGTPSGSGQGCLEIGGQQGMLVYNNNITVSYRTGGLNGYDIKYCMNGYNKGLKIYNNTLVRPPYSGISNDFDFSIEMWNSRGGIEFYGNTISGSIDMSGDDPAPVNDAGGYGFACKVYNNIIGWDTWQNYEQLGVDLERAQTGGFYIYNNNFKHLAHPIIFMSGYDSRCHDVVEDIYIYSNIAYNIGSLSNHSSEFVDLSHIPTDANPNIIYRYIYIINNTAVQGSGGGGTEGFINMHIAGTGSYFNIQNNIIVGLGAAGGVGAICIDGSGLKALTNVVHQNNLYYQNYVDGVGYYYGGSASFDVNNGNIIGDPKFVSTSDFHLQSGSPAIGKGVHITTPSIPADVEGSAINNPPDIGAYKSGSSVAQPVVPVYQSSAIANATPSLLEMTYDQALSTSIIPTVSAFSVLINAVSRTVNAITVSGTKVQLSLSSPVVFGDAISVSYNKPQANPLQATSGGQAVTTGNMTVTNNVNAVNPVYVSSAVASSTPDLLELTYNMNLANIVPPVSSFAVQINSAARLVNAVVISGLKVQLILASRVLPGDVITVSYTKPSGNPLQTTSVGIAANISNQQAVNNCNNIAPTASIVTPSPSSSFTSPAKIAISANATDADGSVTKVEFYNGNTMIGSVSTPPFMFTWNNVAAGNYSLKCIATDNLGAKTTSSVISVSVADKTPARNKHPFVRISNPLKGNTFDNLSSIEIGAVASDSDGTVSTVAFYNGDTQLVELTSSPYTYTWKDVLAGTYTITAIATDNMNDTTISSPVDFVVGNTVKYDPKSDIFNLYPNPNDGHFSIEFVNPFQSERNEIIISDLTGKQVYSGFITKEDIMKQFDISNIRSGMYVMLIKDKEILVTKKFIKQ
jgi:uncharacterized repeat protein (TIGR02059 family)